MTNRNKRQYGYTRPEKHEALTRNSVEYQSGSGHRPIQKTGAAGRSRIVRPTAGGIFSFFLHAILFVIKAPFIAIGFLFGFGNSKRVAALRTKLGSMLWLGSLLALVAFVGLFALASRDLPDPDKLTDRTVAQSTKMYDRTGEHLLYEIFSEQRRTLVTLDQVPRYAVDAIIATEDNDFYSHKGIRPLSILRSVGNGLIGRGRIGGGASTLTQQLVKNAILSSERTLLRKAKEIILSVRLEQKYTKDQILQIYFNEIPYGSTNYGIAAAAHSYFGKKVQDITLSEAATLAALPKAPTTYLNDSDALLERRNFVLRRMAEEGYITEEQRAGAQAEPLTLDRKYEQIQAPHFVLYVKEALVNEYGEQLIDQGGLKVITSLDWDMQQKAEQAVDEQSEKIFADANANNAALVAMDPKSGQILAMVGSRDFYDDDIDGQFNVATLGRRQPGSSFKPIVYAAAFEKGYTPDTILFDVVTNFAASGQVYKPLNYDTQEHGPVTMRQALQGSLNIPAVETLYLVGDKKGVEFAERLGYSTFAANNFGLSLVLGGGEVRLLEHVNAYGVFANGGEYHTPVSLLKVEAPSGEVLFEIKDKKGVRVLKEHVAATMSNVLSDDAARAYIFGAGGILTLPGRPVAVKTGTTNNYVDAWTVGYTPSLVAGVWVGNTDNTPMARSYGGSKIAGPIWHQFMAAALDGTSVESFPPMPPNDATKPALRGSDGGSVTLLVDKVTGKIATSSTPQEYIVERTYSQGHSILHYVQKDDPRGPAPENPSDDPQYGIWEQAIQDWIVRKKETTPDWNVVFEEPPTEFDDSHSLDFIPTLTVISPHENEVLYSRHIQTDILVSAPRGITKVTYRIDGQYVGVIDEHPFNLNYTANALEPGGHTLGIIVEDDVGNKVERDIPFTLQAGQVIPTMSWVSEDQTLSTNDFPRSFFLRPVRLGDIEKVLITAQNQSGELLSLATITSFDSLFDGQLIFTWNQAPSSGQWQLTAVTTAVGGQMSESKTIIQVQ